MKFILFLTRYADDLLGLAGAGLVIYATWLLNSIAAIYVAGAFCLAAAILIGLQPEVKK